MKVKEDRRQMSDTEDRKKKEDVQIVTKEKM